MKSKALRNKLVANLLAEANATSGAIAIAARLFQVGSDHLIVCAKRNLDLAISDLEMFDAVEQDRLDSK